VLSLGLVAMTAGPTWPHIYVHVPFCGRRCSYCDFSIAVRREVPVTEYVDAIMAELVTRRITSSSAPTRSIYFGGGTPSKLGGPGIRRLLAGIAHAIGVEKLSTSVDDLEVTVEANPEDVTEAAAREWVAAGVNRVSLGVQTFDPAVLKWMHREHTADQVGESVRILRGAGIRELSLDLIFALPDVLDRSWTRDLDEALKLDPDHLSLYGLTVEPATPLGRWTARGEVQQAPEERYADEFLEAHERLEGAGFQHYEVSNYSRPGRRARHNSSYWSGVPYLGLGPSAHGFDGAERRWNASAYAEWLRRVGLGVDPVEGRELLGPAEHAAEQVYLGLRTSDGLTILQSELKTVTPWLQAGWGRIGPDPEAPDSAGRLTLTASGWLRLDAIAAALTSLRSPS
jgi:oxygen-independent coproporphyrinogen-3 oxidase